MFVVRFSNAAISLLIIIMIVELVDRITKKVTSFSSNQRLHVISSTNENKKNVTIESFDLSHE